MPKNWYHGARQRVCSWSLFARLRIAAFFEGVGDLSQALARCYGIKSICAHRGPLPLGCMVYDDRLAINPLWLELWGVSAKSTLSWWFSNVSKTHGKCQIPNKRLEPLGYVAMYWVKGKSLFTPYNRTRQVLLYSCMTYIGYGCSQIQRFGCVSHVTFFTFFSFGGFFFRCTLQAF